MKHSTTKATKEIHDRPTYQKIILWPFYMILWLWNLSLRMEFVGDGKEQFRAMDRPYMIVTWHNTLFTVPILIKRVRKEKAVHALVSASKDGAWLVAIFELIGFRAIRGSANFRGAQSLKELIRSTRKGHDLGITPDGSKGPAYVLKPGVAGVGRACKTGFILVGLEHHRSWRLKSWDRFFIPKPFSKVTIRIKRIESYETLGEPDPYKASWMIQKEMMQLMPEDPLIADPAKQENIEL